MRCPSCKVDGMVDGHAGRMLIFTRVVDHQPETCIFASTSLPALVCPACDERLVGASVLLAFEREVARQIASGSPRTTPSFRHLRASRSP